jgi:hypothetical protein
MGTKKGLRLAETAHPVIYEVNVRVLLPELSRAAKKRITLGTIPEGLLRNWANAGVDAVWLMGVWTTGDLSRTIARSHEGLREEYRKALPDGGEADIDGSPYSLTGYSVPRAYGGEAGLKKLRSRLAALGIGLFLDFVANHTGRDHPWVFEHPEYYIGGEEHDEERRPDIFFRTTTCRGELTLAYGRDPTFPGWTDTAQLNLMFKGTRERMIEELLRIAKRCDGVRCDMAMLLLRDVFLLTWGERIGAGSHEGVEAEFWKEAIDAIRAVSPRFFFIAEAYWNMEWQLQQQGFDLTYDKVLYDRLLREGASAVRDHLRAEPAYQRRSLRFIENHDEPRAARAFSSEAWHYAAAVIATTVPGGVLLHDGEFEGRQVRLPIQLTRRPEEEVAVRTREFYQRLLSVIRDPAVRRGEWKLLSTRPAWHDNHTWQNFIVHWWEWEGALRMVVVNYAPHSGQCYVEMPVDRLGSRQVEFRDEFGESVYVRDAPGLAAKGMYFDLPPYGFHFFDVRPTR